MKTLLVIPAYNEQESIASTVETVRAAGYDYVVVNDGSTDNTTAICRQNQYRFIDLPINLGLAGAFQAGIKYAHAHEYDCVVQFDADGQHLVEYVEVLIGTLASCDIAIGSRFVSEKKSASMRMIGSNLLSSMIRITTGKKLTDPTSGMRAYNARAINELLVGPNLGPEPDTIAYLMKKKKLKVEEVQVHMGERLAGTSYLNWRNSSLYMLRMTFSVLLVQLFR